MATQRQGLVEVKKTVQRGGKTFEQTFWLRPEDAKRLAEQGAKQDRDAGANLARARRQAQAQRDAQAANAGPARDKPSVASALRPVGGSDLKPHFDEAMALIAKVHSDGVLPDLKVERTASKSMEAGFHYDDDPPPKVFGLSCSVAGPHPAGALIHEVGHLLDFHAAAPGKFASETAKMPEMRALQKAIDDSRSVRRLRDLDEGRLDDLGEEDAEYVAYALETKELFARAYAQYVAHRTGDAKFKKYLAAENRGPVPTQWGDREFEPIARAFDALFLRLGWRANDAKQEEAPAPAAGGVREADGRPAGGRGAGRDAPPAVQPRPRSAVARLQGRRVRRGLPG